MQQAAFRFQKAVSIVKIQDLSRGCGHILGLFYGECEKKSVKNNPSMIEYK